MHEDECVESVHAAGEEADFGGLQRAKVDYVEAGEPGEGVEEEAYEEGEAREEREP